MFQETNSDDRALSSVLGYTLLVGISTLGITSVVVFGGVALSDMQHTAEIERAEQSFGILDTHISTVALGESDRLTLGLGLSGERPGTSLGYQDRGWVRIAYENTTSGVESVVTNETMGAISYTNGDTSVVYQGGGIWRDSAGSKAMVSPPEFHYRDGSLTFSLVSVDGPASLNNHVTIEKNGSVTNRYPNTSQQANFSNPVPENVTVSITVGSRFYRQWGEYFEKRTDGDVSYDDARQTATVTLVRPLPKVESALTVAGGSGLLIEDQVVVDSYDSTDATPTFGGANADIVTDSSVDLWNQIDIRGNLTVGESADISNVGSSGQVRGSLSYTTGSVSQAECDDHVGAWCEANASVESRQSVDVRVGNRIDRINASNDNDASPHVTDGSLDWTGTNHITLGTGEYHFDDTFQVQGSSSNPQNLTLDTTDGDIEIAVENTSVQVQNYGNITVKGDGVVRIYNDEQVQIQDHASVWVPGYDSRQLWMYCTSACGVDVNSGSPSFVGVVYAPRAGGGIQLQGDATLYGGVVGGGQVTIQDDVVLHYDEALATEDVLTGGPSTIYMHVTTNRAKITSG